jgi:hypothetical protein
MNKNGGGAWPSFLSSFVQAQRGAGSWAPLLPHALPAHTNA